MKEVGGVDRAALARRQPAELVDAIGQLHALSSATLAALLDLVAAFDASEAWRDDGATSMTAWLAMSLGVSHQTASEWVRLARALDDLPAVAGAFSEGRLSFDQVRALTRFATPGDDEELARAAPGWSAAYLEALARRLRRLSADEVDDAHRRRSVRVWWDRDRRMLHLRGRLPDARGAVVATALERLAGKVPPDARTGTSEAYEVRCADALVDLAGAHLGAEVDPDRATVVVHTDASVLRGDEGVAELEAGIPIPASTVRRLACDARVQVVAHSADGTPVGVGRTSRSVPPWLARLVRRRDRGCRFPGCGRTRWCHIHHLVHWADGGRTDLATLIWLCGTHHRLVHEGGWRITGDPDGVLAFIRPDGRALRVGPPALRPEVGHRFFAPPDDRPPPRPPLPSSPHARGAGICLRS